MSRSSDGYFSQGSGRRPNASYGSSGGSYRQNSGSYGSRRSQGQGMLISPWEGGVVPGSGGVAQQRTAATPDIVASINQLSRMDNPESELALNILNAVLTKKEESQWGGQRAWEGAQLQQKRRMDWDDQHSIGSGRGMLPTPEMPPSKMPRLNNNIGAMYSWGVVEGGFNWRRPVKGRGGAARTKGRGGTSGASIKGKQPNPAKQTKTASWSSNKTGGRMNKQVKIAPKTGGVKVKVEPKSSATKEAAETATSVDEKAEGDANVGGTAGGEVAVTAEAEALTKPSTKETDQKKKKKKPCPVPLSYLRCHICKIYKFNNSSNFTDHIMSKKHRRMAICYKEKTASILKLLKAQSLLSQLKVQWKAAAVGKLDGKITKCGTCDCPIKGDRGRHKMLKQHRMVSQFTKCIPCKRTFRSRAELEAHKLTFGHMKIQCELDDKTRKRFMNSIKKEEKEHSITEQSESRKELHEMVTQMQLDNLSTHVWTIGTIPMYDPAVPTGLNHLVKKSLFVCPVCPKKVNHTPHEALEHTKTKAHYDSYLAHLKALEVKEEKGETSDKENEVEESAIKKEDIEKQKEIEKEDEGNKDMDNMVVIDEEVNQDDDEEEEEEKVLMDAEKEEEVEAEDNGELSFVEEVGEDLEEVGEDMDVEETVESDDKTTSSVSVTPEAKTGASTTQNCPPLETSPAPAPDALNTVPSKPSSTPQTRQGRTRGRGWARGARGRK